MSWGRSTVMTVRGEILVDSVVDRDTVDQVMGLAGASQFRNTIEPVAFASAAAFAVAGDSIRFSILTPPEVAREASGQARWLVVTDSRVVEVSGEMRGDWWSRSTYPQRLVGSIAVSTSPLTRFSGLVFTGPGWIWDPEGPDSVGDFMRDTTAVLQPVDGSEGLVLWKDYVDSGSVFPKPSDLLTALRWLVTRLSTGREGA